MRTLTAAILLALAAGSASAQDGTISKEQDCRYQAQVAAAVQKARLEGVREKKVAEAIARSKPGWPARYDNAIPIFVGAVYGMKKRDLRGVDLGAQWMDMCMHGGVPPAAD